MANVTADDHDVLVYLDIKGINDQTESSRKKLLMYRLVNLFTSSESGNA